jgi:type IV pilus assembly protein PilV
MRKNINGLGRKKRIKEQGGFTLIEVLIGLSILTVGILAVATMQISAIRGNHFSDNTTTALILAEQKMEDLLNRDFNDPALTNTEPANDNNLGSTETIDHEELLEGTFRRIWNIDDDNPYMDDKTITVTVTWRQDKHKVFLTSIKRP